ncbi:flap structure-specific endonuclease [Striga asiatica]|uniref:Flap structure-specific endonuclease n=1 Tax=Striga asiatica TaxID=4170 RepID=A0A5A7PMP0_STRAF|nr:flap structure-specific endonuclease [Striga asiatica]
MALLAGPRIMITWMRKLSILIFHRPHRFAFSPFTHNTFFLRTNKIFLNAADDAKWLEGINVQVTLTYWINAKFLHIKQHNHLRPRNFKHRRKILLKQANLAIRATLKAARGVGESLIEKIESTDEWGLDDWKGKCGIELRAQKALIFRFDHRALHSKRVLILFKEFGYSEDVVWIVW